MLGRGRVRALCFSLTAQAISIRKFNTSRLLMKFNLSIHRSSRFLRQAVAVASCHVFLFSATAQTPPQPQVTLTPTAPDTWNAAWQGIAHRTYFLQRSTDLINWTYTPLMDFGVGNKTQTLVTSSPKFFTRLVTVDNIGVTTLTQARDADFDADGISNSYELETLGTDPLSKNGTGGDLDGDGLSDAYELSIGLDPFLMDTDGDGTPDQDDPAPHHSDWTQSTTLSLIVLSPFE